jgi:hypothetical protein
MKKFFIEILVFIITLFGIISFECYSIVLYKYSFVWWLIPFFILSLIIIIPAINFWNKYINDLFK